MNLYEAMFIFPETVKEEALDEVVGRAKAEIEKAGGQIASTIRLGKRGFARRMKKQDCGHYVVVGFRMEGAQVAPLKERYRLSEEILRVQINRAEEEAPAAVKAAADTDGVAQ